MSLLQEQLAPTVGPETNTLSTRFSLKMVSTRSKAGASKQVDAGPSGPSRVTPNLAAILDGQMKMQQELANLKKRNAEEIEALKQENSRLRRKIEADADLKGKAKETSEAVKSPAFQPTEEESEYNPTPTLSPPPNKPLSLPHTPNTSHQVTQDLPHPQQPTFPTTYPLRFTPRTSHPTTPHILPQPTSPLITSPPPSLP